MTRRRTVKQKACLASKSLYKLIQFIDPGPVSVSAKADFNPREETANAIVTAKAGKKELFGMQVEHKNGRLVFVN